MAGEYLNPMECGFKPQQSPRRITNEDAIRILDGIISEVQALNTLTNVDDHKFNKVVYDLQNIKKDIPIKIKNREYCPTCGRYLDRIGGLVDDCLYCGQKIDWEI